MQQEGPRDGQQPAPGPPPAPPFAPDDEQPGSGVHHVMPPEHSAEEDYLATVSDYDIETDQGDPF